MNTFRFLKIKIIKLISMDLFFDLFPLIIFYGLQTSHRIPFEG